ncbi:MAG: insulinase family protein [Deltaproteobacteria bacterium]|nr:insulinase family protein [Deltaproteobacteria bacterium]
MRALVLALLVAAGPVSAATPSPPSVFPWERHSTTLDNGLRVVVVKTAAKGSFALYGVVGVGSRDEVEAGHSGFAHFFEHMMFKGTKSTPAPARTALLGRLGVDESGYTTDDFTTYHLAGPSDALPQIIALEGDRYQHLSIEEALVKVESRAVLGEYNKDAAKPDEKAFEVLSDLAFDKHTYKHTTIGLLADIERMPNETAYARSFFQRFYTPDNLLLVVVGDVDPSSVVQQVTRAFGGWKGKRAATTTKDEPALTKERRKAVPWGSPTLERLHVGWRVPSTVRDLKAAALTGLVAGYFFSGAAALNKRVVLDEQLAEELRAGYALHKDAALFPVVARLREGASVDVVLERIQSALDRVAAGDVDQRAFDAVKSNLRYGVLMNLTDADSVAGTLAWYSGPSMDVSTIDRVLDETARTTPADLSAFVKAHFGREQRAVVTLKHTPGTSGGAK